MSTTNNTIGTGYEGNIREQISGYFLKVKSGDMGSLPAMIGLIVLAILFSIMSPVFLTSLNFANLFNQAAALIVMAMGLVFVLILAEIDLSAGVTAGVSAAMLVIALNAELHWTLAIAIAVVSGVVIGYFIGIIVAKVGIPSFVVTLACFLAFQGLQLLIIGSGGLYRIESSEILAIQNSNLSIMQGWIFYIVSILLLTYSGFAARRRRSRNGQPNRPITFLYVKIAVAGILGLIIVAALNLERSSNKAFPIHGVPIVVPVVLVLWVFCTFILDRTKFGRYVYALGGNPEAARRAGIQVNNVKIAVFMNIIPPMIFGWCVFAEISLQSTLAGLLTVGFARALQQQMTFCVNSLLHVCGSKKYTSDSSGDIWWLFVFLLGENWHNFHHAFPRDYRNGHKWYHGDFHKLIILLMSKCGLAWDLVETSEERIAAKMSEINSNIKNDYQMKLADVEIIAIRLANLAKQKVMMLEKSASEMVDSMTNKTKIKFHQIEESAMNLAISIKAIIAESEVISSKIVNAQIKKLKALILKT